MRQEKVVQITINYSTTSGNNFTFTPGPKWGQVVIFRISHHSSNSSNMPFIPPWLFEEVQTHFLNVVLICLHDFKWDFRWLIFVEKWYPMILASSYPKNKIYVKYIDLWFFDLGSTDCMWYFPISENLLDNFHHRRIIR